MVKRKKETDKKERRKDPARFDKHFNMMGSVSIVLLMVAFVYVLYYLYVVVSTGLDPTGTILTDFTQLVVNILQLFTENAE
jgi:hypothetical protein